MHAAVKGPRQLLAMGELPGAQVCCGTAGTAVAPAERRKGRNVRELEASLQQFGEFLLRARLVKEKAAPYCVRWVRRFLTRPASNEPLADQVRRFCEDLERGGSCQDRQIRQAEHALRTKAGHYVRLTMSG
jgi:hypothetical protein